MNLNIYAIREKAQFLQGCLSDLRTKISHRRHRISDDPLHLGDEFVGDEAKLFLSKTFRVLGDKTQVFTFPQTPLIRSRKVHVEEVVGVSVVASEMLGLNTSLVRAAALGHDIGHVPFGHQGEAWMARAMGKPFCHEVMGPIVAQRIERQGKGLNLTWDTLDAMMRHSGDTAREGMSQEAWLLRYTDKFTYLFADFNDIFVRMEYPLPAELRDLFNEFGCDQRERGTTAICGLVIESAEYNKISFEQSELARKFKRIRTLMYDIYPRVTNQNVNATMEPVLEFLTKLGLGDPFLLLALMTDKEVADLAATPMKDLQVFNRTAVSEILPYLQSIGPIDLCDPDLDSWVR